ncbi:MAG: alpha/beta hydrolase [Pyrinomonadaceae bacterium]
MKDLRSHIFVILIAAIFTATQALAQAKPVEIWPLGKMPGAGAKDPEANMPDRGDGVRRITNVSTPTIEIFRAAKQNAPAVIVSAGGGYNYVTYNKEGTEVAKWLNANGITAIVLKYRNPNNRAGALQDVQRAIRLARTNTKQWNVDPKRLGVMGFSAGGHASARASTDFDNVSYRAIDDADKKSARPDFAMLIYPAYLEKDGRIAAELNLRAKIPPTLIVSTEDDRSFVLGCKVYHAALDEAKIQNKFLLYPTGGHGYGLRSDKAAKAWPEDALEWLREMKILK